ncbi:MAG TPA: 6-carboxytetrahydropterin synthase, partial [Polyangiaceae bacterium]|nr:6-carboxytetrahydropterin synthase [Polyangiaceae bacterium]
MYEITSGIHIHFAHHVRGHAGPCISLHGHTWLFQVTLAAADLDGQGFVEDFDAVQKQVLSPCHALLDHSLAIGEKTFSESREQLQQLGQVLVASRKETLGDLGTQQASLEGDLEGARNHFTGGIKVCVFPFSPTSER